MVFKFCWSLCRNSSNLILQLNLAMNSFLNLKPEAYKILIKTYLSAPAHDNILLMRMTWKGWSRIRMWNWSFPQFLTMYLLAQMRPASSASLLSCSYSSDTKCTQSGKSSTRAFFLPKSKILILASGTPRQNRDFGYGLFLQYR